MKQGHTYNFYISALRRAIPLIVVVCVVSSLVAYGVASRAGTAYSLHFSYSISLAEREDADDYTFDGYYALQATDLFAATLSRWLTAPEVVAAAYERENLPLLTDVRSLARQVRAEKTAPQLVQVTLVGQDPELLQRLAIGLRDEIDATVERYHLEGTPTLHFNVVTTREWIGEQPVAVRVITIATFMVALLLSTNVVLFRASFYVDS